MNRINVYSYPDPDALAYDNPTILVGWFDRDRVAESIEERTEWDGNNLVSIHAAKYNHEHLYRTAQGRWVLHRWSQWQGSQPTYEYIGDDKARTWLLHNHDYEIVERYFGELAEEQGPGRPEVGPAISVAFPPALLARVDAAAKDAGQTRAAWIRSACTQQVGERPAVSYDINRDGIADLALPADLDQRLSAALDGEHRHEIADAINEAISAKLAEHGISESGEWYGEWSAAEIVTGVLDRYADR